MVVQLGQMQLPAPQDPDPSDDYFNGTISGGGLWTALTRASDHDHTGGVNGKPISVAGIPDGSITTAKLDPSVLLPYALVDGSKPFTGQVTMNADQLIRNTLYFGAKPAGVADATLARTGAGALRADTHLGVGVTPAAWGGGYVGLQVGQSGALWSNTSGAFTFLSSNVMFDGARKAITTAAACEIELLNGGVNIATAPSVAAGAAQSMTTRANINTTGTLTLTPDAEQYGLDIRNDRARAQFLATTDTVYGRVGAEYAGSGMHLSNNLRTTAASGGWQRDDAAKLGAALSIGSGGTILNLSSSTAGSANTPAALVTRMQMTPNGTLSLAPDAGQPAITSPTSLTLTSGQHIILGPAGGGFYVMPAVDNLNGNGHPSFRWTAVYAVAGAINTSAAAAKAGITPLSPAECYQAAKDVRWYEYAYLPPPYLPPEPPPDIAYDAADDNETKAEKKASRDEAEAQAREAHLKMVAETAPARHQRGFVFPAGAESKDEAGGALPPVPDLFGLSDRESTTPQADLATLGCALQEVIRRLELLETQP